MAASVMAGIGLVVGTNSLYGALSSALTSEEAFTLPKLPYAYDALEPYIDAVTMETHHGKHHAGYTRKLNNALKQVPAFQNQSIENILGQLSQVPENVRTAVRNNGGGYYNHKLFWEILGPAKGQKPGGSLLRMIDKSFGSYDRFRDQFFTKAKSVFGSGWAWLVKTPEGSLLITTSPNQDNPLMDTTLDVGTPIMGLDVWEHAYYLKYKNKRGDYINAFWNVVNWEQVADNYANA